ncbi:bifunctional diguanylate cyclase/phosphodiesterase [Lachnotalea sp. AF33-28]|uniref:bifunctional diguanylate cyclase/phosphodiesterase n=1 Tax=Lachnotalea sp. AF33-28 TaxID=2292046 RepID=UPI000E550DB6|nr:GGDEF and EAL domain-containing protein [Lachnotalea sp. AF33-28]RHP34355.1 EAL domain-containing protein [Lachnotalea sp. AF33-28]
MDKEAPMKTVEEFIKDFEYDSNELYEALSVSTDEYVYVCDMRRRTIRYPADMVEEFGLPGEIVQDPLPCWKDIIHKDDWNVFYETNMESFSGELIHHVVEYRARNKKGTYVWLQCRGAVVKDKDGVPYLFAGFISNLGKRNRIDHQTGLFNKYEFQSRIESWLKEGKNLPFGVLFLGVDNFKHVNELYNREFGDEVLRILSQKMQSVLPYNAECYRLDGDEFGVLMKDTTKEELQECYSLIRKAFDRQQSFRGNKYYCTISCGGCMAPKDGRQYLELARCAEYSLDYSKRHGKNRATFYSTEIAVDFNRSLELIELLRESVERGFEGFSLVYQPQVDAADGRMKGVEALLRWKCDKYGAMVPSDFIPLLEESGLIRQVGKWVMKEAAAVLSRWNRYSKDLTMSINISYHQVICPRDEGPGEDVFSYLVPLLTQQQVKMDNIILEFTESYVASDLEDLKEKLNSVRRMGIKVAIDDFGVGYSSLGVLKEAPVDLVKIDRVFINGIGKDDFDAAFIRLVTALCHQVGIRVCQEGVETKEECDRVCSMGPDYIQGFYYSRPVTEQELFEKYICPKDPL